MSKFEYQKNSTPITEFMTNLVLLCENELCEEAHARILGKAGALYKDKAIVFLVDRYASLIHDGMRHDELASVDALVKELHQKWAEQAYDEARNTAWIIAEMLY